MMRHSFRIAVGIAAALVVGGAVAVQAGSVSPAVRDAFRLPQGIEAIDRAIDSFQRRDYDRCYTQLEVATSTRPDLGPARLMLAKLYLLDNQGAACRATLDRAAAEHPDHPDIYLTLGKLALQEGRLTDAWLQFEKAAALAPTAKIGADLKRSIQVESHTGRAIMAEGRKDWPAAEASLAAWLVLDPTNGKARQRLGRALFHQGKRDKAYEELQRAVKEDPSLDPSAITMGQLFTEAGDPKKAAEWMEYAVAQSPKEAKSHLGYAIWLLDQDRPEQARRGAETAAKLGSSSTEIKALRGLIAWHLKDFLEAERIFQSLHLDAPASFSANNQWALALVEQSDDAKRRRAQQVAEINARLYPNSGEALTTLGWVAYRQGRLDDAERTLHAALATGNASSETAYYLARVLADLGRTAEVKPLLRLCLDTPGRFAHRKETQEWFDRLAEGPKTDRK